MMQYDLVILCHPKDYVKLEFCINSCLEFFNPKPDGIYIVSPDKFESDQVFHVSDDEAITNKKGGYKLSQAKLDISNVCKSISGFYKERPLYDSRLRRYI